MQVPIVDFSNCGILTSDVKYETLEMVGKAVYDALANVGFVYLSNTGLPRCDVEDAFRVSKTFFELPRDVKTQYQFDQNYSGYHDICRESTNPERPNDYKESFQLGGMALAAGKDVWPDKEVEGFSRTLGKLYGHCKTIALRLLEALSAGMELKDRQYLSRCHSRIGEERNYTTLRSLYYPPLANGTDVLPNQMRLGEHTDFGSFTLLFQGEIGGLEIESVGGKYITVDPVPDTVLVNIGDLLQLWTNGRLKSTKHRIRNPEEASIKKQARQSIVCFIHPNYEVELDELDFRHLPTNKVSRHRSTADKKGCVTAVEYAEMRYHKSYS